MTPLSPFSGDQAPTTNQRQVLTDREGELATDTRTPSGCPSPPGSANRSTPTPASNRKSGPALNALVPGFRVVRWFWIADPLVVVVSPWGGVPRGLRSCRVPRL